MARRAAADTMPMDLYDRFGNAVAYSDDGEHIYLFSGEPASYLTAEAVYSYGGDQLGWYEDGWVRDKNGRCVAYSQWAGEGPQHRTATVPPHKSDRQARPAKELREPRALRPIHSNAWSEVAAKDFFAPRAHPWPGHTALDGRAWSRDR